MGGVPVEGGRSSRPAKDRWPLVQRQRLGISRRAIATVRRADRQTPATRALPAGSPGCVRNWPAPPATGLECTNPRIGWAGGVGGGRSQDFQRVGLCSIRKGAGQITPYLRELLGELPIEVSPSPARLAKCNCPACWNWSQSP